MGFKKKKKDGIFFFFLFFFSLIWDPKVGSHVQKCNFKPEFANCMLKLPQKFVNFSKFARNVRKFAICM